MLTCRFGVRPSPNGSDASFEVFDRVTGAAVVSGLRRLDAEREARRRNHDASSGSAMTVHLGPAEVPLRDTRDVYLAFEVAGQDRCILEDLNTLFAGWRVGDG